jgi:hypothetical protein
VQLVRRCLAARQICSDGLEEASVMRTRALFAVARGGSLILDEHQTTRCSRMLDLAGL